MGDRTAQLRRATEALIRDGEATLVAHSSVYASAALLKPEAPASWNWEYHNAVIAINTSLPPLDLLRAAKRIEALLGRRARGEWAPREIDVDILTYDDVFMATPELILPHPHMLRRDFVMLPMADIAPDAFAPGIFPLTTLRAYVAENFSESKALLVSSLFTQS